jgi:flagellar assembly protein FliH
METNVKTSAKIVSSDQVQSYQLGQFIGANEQTNLPAGTPYLNNKEINGNVDPVLVEIRNLANKLSEIENKVTNIQNDGITGRQLDQQIIQAMKDLKNYATFFEQAALQMESKLLKTSISIAQKIIAIEVGENSTKIAKETINSILEKIKSASKVTIHLNPKDYIILKNELQLEPYITLSEDSNVTAGGVVIASDLGNFDGSVEAKVKTLLDSLDIIKV